jgi:hypothetical protein
MKIIITLCLTWYLAFSYAQDIKQVYFHIDKKSIKYPLKKDSLALYHLKQKAFNQFAINGYVGLKIEDSLTKKNNLHYFLSADTYFKKIILQTDQQQIISDFEHTPYQINKQITNLENSGFPFAKIDLIDQRIKNNKLYLTYRIDSGQFVSIDKIHVKSNDPFNQKTILNLIGLESGDPYSENKLRKIDGLLNASNLYSLVRPPEVLFFNNKAEIYLYIKKEKASSADGYVGLLQDKNTQKLSLNGYINLKLQNTLNRAELLNLNWKANPDQTQKLVANLDYPFLFNSPFGISGDLNLHKQDTTFVRSNLIGGLNYKQAFFQIGIYNQFENSFLIDTNYQQDFRSYKKNTIGTKLILSPQFVGKFNFYRPKIELMTGFFQYKSDSIVATVNTGNIKFDGSIEQKIKFYNYFTFTNKSSYQFIKSSYNLSRNELIYFGGLKSLRGFYELELTGNNVFIMQNEISYQPLSILSFKVLYDFSTYEFNKRFTTNSLGFGFGLINNNSILEIIIANGVVNNAPVALSNTKIHIGFSSNF